MEIITNKLGFYSFIPEYMEFSRTSNAELTTDKTWKIYPHMHDNFEIYILLSGQVNYQIGEQVYAVSPGDILCIPSNTLHMGDIVSVGNYERFFINVHPRLMDKLSTPDSNLKTLFEQIVQGALSPLLSAERRYTVVIQQILSRMEAAVKENAYGSDVMLFSQISQLLLYLNRFYLHDATILPAGSTGSELIDRILRYINANLQEDIKLYEVAEKHYVSQQHLARQFKSFTGFTFHQYIMEKRLRLASYLLDQGQSVTAVIEACGFSDYSNFIRAFKNKYGLPPKKYAEQADRLHGTEA